MGDVAADKEMVENSSIAMKFCKNCGTETERNAGGICKICRKASIKKYYETSKEKVLAGNKKWRDANKERFAEMVKNWGIENKDRQKAKAREYAQSHREQMNAKSRAFKARNPEKTLEQAAKWRKANPEKRRVAQHNRRARLMSGGRLSSNIIQVLHSNQKGKCPCCGLPLGNDFHLDHIMPLALGGKNVNSNVQLLRAECNMQKHTSDPIDFMQQRGFLL